MMPLITCTVIIIYAAFVQWVWGWSSVLLSWVEAGWFTAPLGLAGLFGTYVLRTWRIYDYFPAETAGQFGRLLRLVQVHNLLNIMLPFRSGEASFPLLMRREFALSLARGTSALLVMRLLDLHALLGAVGAGISLQINRLWAWTLWMIFLILPAVAFALRGPLIRAARKYLPTKALALLDRLEAGLPNGAGAFFRAWAATLLNWFVKVAALAWVFGLLAGLSVSASLGGAVGGELSSVLPVHAPAGAGTYPAAIVAGTIAFDAEAGRSALSALGQAAVNTHLLVISASLAGTILSLLLVRVRLIR